MWRLLALVVVTPVVGAAQQPGAALVAHSGAASLPVSHFREAAQGFTQHSGVSDSLRVVIRDPASWERYWTIIHRPFIPAPPVPTIDFQREMIVLAALGSQPSGGFAIRIESAVADSTRLVVQLRRSVPGSGCAVPAVVTQPLDLARIPTTTLPVAFAERLDRTDCSGGKALHRR